MTDQPDFSHLPLDQRGRAERNHRLAQYEAEQAAAREAAQPKGDPVGEYFDGSTFINENVEAAAREAAAVTAARGGNAYEQREAAMKAAQQAAARSADPLDNGDTPTLGQFVKETTEDVALREEIRLLREQLEARDAPLPDPSTVSTEFYFENRERYLKERNIRQPKWGQR